MPTCKHTPSLLKTLSSSFLHVLKLLRHLPRKFPWIMCFYHHKSFCRTCCCYYNYSLLVLNFIYLTLWLVVLNQLILSHNTKFIVHIDPWYTHNKNFHEIISFHYQIRYIETFYIDWLLRNADYNLLHWFFHSLRNSVIEHESF